MNPLQIVFYFLLFKTIQSQNSKEKNFDFKISTIHNRIRNRTWKCTDVLLFFYQRIFEYDALLKTVIALNPHALHEAIQLDTSFAKRNYTITSRLHCIPILVKDNIDVVGMPTTGGLFALNDSYPLKDATVVARLRASGAIVIAKMNLGELASGSHQSEVGGMCRNPWDPLRSCGPSSIGSGAGLAAGFGIISIGTDTGGSIMTPSSYNYLFGLRPALNQISIDGIIPSFERQDTVGPMAKHLDDLVLAYSVMADNHTVHDEFHKQTNDIKHLRLGYLTNFFKDFHLNCGNSTYFIDEQIRNAMSKAMDNLRTLKVRIVRYEMNQSRFNEFMDLACDIVATGVSVCQRSCFEYSYDKYFADPTRFNSHAHMSFDKFLKSAKLSAEWYDQLTSQSNATKNSTKQTCNQSCMEYDSLRLQFQAFVRNWFDNGKIDAFIFPTKTSLPPNLESGNDTPSIDPTFISPFTGYSTLNIPIGYSRRTPNAPTGLPIGMLLLAPPENLLKMFEIAKYYEKSFMKINPLPVHTPLVNGDLLKKQQHLMCIIISLYFTIATHLEWFMHF